MQANSISASPSDPDRTTPILIGALRGADFVWAHVKKGGVIAKKKHPGGCLYLCLIDDLDFDLGVIKPDDPDLMAKTVITNQGQA